MAPTGLLVEAPADVVKGREETGAGGADGPVGRRTVATAWPADPSLTSSFSIGRRRMWILPVGKFCGDQAAGEAAAESETVREDGAVTADVRPTVR